MTLAEALGVILRQHRNRINKSQTDLAAIVDMERTSISAIENGRYNISMTNFMRLCEGLETDPRTILDEALKRMGK